MRLLRCYPMVNASSELVESAPSAPRLKKKVCLHNATAFFRTPHKNLRIVARFRESRGLHADL